MLLTNMRILCLLQKIILLELYLVLNHILKVCSDDGQELSVNSQVIKENGFTYPPLNESHACDKSQGQGLHVETVQIYNNAEDDKCPRKLNLANSYDNHFMQTIRRACSGRDRCYFVSSLRLVLQKVTCGSKPADSFVLHYVCKSLDPDDNKVFNIKTGFIKKIADPGTDKYYLVLEANETIEHSRCEMSGDNVQINVTLLHADFKSLQSLRGKRCFENTEVNIAWISLNHSSEQVCLSYGTIELSRVTGLVWIEISGSQSFTVACNTSAVSGSGSSTTTTHLSSGTTTLSPASTTATLSPASTTATLSPASTTANSSPASTTANSSPASTTANSSPASTTANSSPASTTANSSPASTTANSSPASTTANSSPASTTANSSPAFTTANSSPAFTTANSSPAFTTANSSPASTTANSSPASTTANSSPASTTANSSPASTTANSSPAFTTANSSSTTPTTTLSSSTTTTTLSSTSPPGDANNNTSEASERSSQIHVAVPVSVVLIVVIIAVILVGLCLRHRKRKRLEYVHQDEMLNQPGEAYEYVTMDKHTKTSPTAITASSQRQSRGVVWGRPTSANCMKASAQPFLSHESTDQHRRDERVPATYAMVNKVRNSGVASAAASSPGTASGNTSERGVADSTHGENEYSHLAGYRNGERMTENHYDG